MRNLLAWLGAATLVVLWSASVQAAGGSALKPYVVLILDTSGSMQGATNSGPPDCGGTCSTTISTKCVKDADCPATETCIPPTDTKLNHAKCAIGNIANSYGDMVLAFSRFRNVMAGSTTANTFPTGCCSPGPDNGAGGGCNAGVVCNAQDEMFEMLTPLLDNTNSSTAKWVDFTGNTCTASGTDPEVWNASSNTPLDGVLKGSKDYWAGRQANTHGLNTATEAGTTATFTLPAGQTHDFAIGERVVVTGVGVAGYNGTWTVVTVPSNTATTSNFTATLSTSGLAASSGGTAAAEIWPTSSAGFDPINQDPTNAVFLPSGCDPSAGCTGATCCTSQCRPYVVILLTDGDETCGGTPGDLVNSGAAQLLSTTPRNDALGITAISRAANVVTVTTAANHTFLIGERVVVAGVTNATFNGTFTITAIPAANQIRYAQNAANAASSGGTASHVAFQNKYRVVTKPIGFGVGVGYQPIEDIAHAGGNPDVPGINEGYYASDEAGLELAISRIIEDSIRTELCNNLDDDCDTKIDEDFPNKGNACDDGKLGKCKGTGNLGCRADGTGLQCNITMPGGNPQTTCPNGKTCNGDNSETCQDGIDDDCDGKIDEGCTVCTPVGETCNNKDDDCDGSIDEGLSRQCGTGSCLGTEVCTAGVWGGCTAKNPTQEICNGQDDDCDGIADGFTLGCSDMVTPGGPATDNPGDPSHNPIPQNICHPGQKTCPVSPPGTGVFGACTGEQKPLAEICNGLDDDCDNQIDEDFNSQPCSTNCGVGMTQCIGGVITCNANPSTSDATCNNVDDDCDMKIDEDWMCNDPNSSPFAACACGQGVVCNGQAKCINGTVQCIGDPINQETCNCNDDDCDGSVDEGTTCPGGATCTSCQCAFPCSGGEFPCPLGKKCNMQNFCVNDPCYGVSCPDVSGHKQVCIDQMNNGVCVDACSQVTCQQGFVCIDATGDCKPDDCTTFPNRCQPNENCVVDQNGHGQCVSNPCQGVTCPTDQYCVGGNCITSCSGVTCPAGQRCRLGMCEADPCGHPCPFGQVCYDNDGKCHDDPCKFQQCPQGQWCNPNDAGMCEPDPCVGTTCPGMGQVCKGGTCYDPAMFQPDAGIETHVTVGGGGCSTTGGGSSLLVAFALILVRRRRRGGAS